MLDTLAQAETKSGIAVRDLTVTYRNGHTALFDASFEIPTGTITGLVGVNGSGKSTLFKSIMGFVPAAKGTISILGQSVESALKNNVVAYVPQAEEVDWSFPVLVEDVVMMGRYGHMNFMRMIRDKDRRAVSEALERVGMSDFRKRQIGELSGGQKKRVFLARALAQDGRTDEARELDGEGQEEERVDHVEERVGVGDLARRDGAQAFGPHEVIRGG